MPVTVCVLQGCWVTFSSSGERVTYPAEPRRQHAHPAVDSEQPPAPSSSVPLPWAAASLCGDPRLSPHACSQDLRQGLYTDLPVRGCPALAGWGFYPVSDSSSSGGCGSPTGLRQHQPHRAVCSPAKSRKPNPAPPCTSRFRRRLHASSCLVAALRYLQLVFCVFPGCIIIIPGRVTLT